jgi:predicted dehydrogenase
VCDVVEEQARLTAEKFGVPSWFRTIEELLTQAKIEAVLIATPIPAHYQNAMAAIEAGKHVYLQKTMTTTVEEATTVIDSASERGLKLVVSPGQMLSPAYQQLRNAIQQQIIGVPYWAIASTSYVGHEHEPFRAETPIDPTWYYKPGGGPVYDMAVYTLHGLTGLLGPASQVTAMSAIGLPVRRWPGGGTTVEMDDNTLLLLNFDGCFGVVGGHFCQTGKVIGWGFMGIYGSSGSIEITGLAAGTGYPELAEFVNARATADFDSGTYTAANLEGLPPLVGDRHAEMEEAHVWADIHHFAVCIMNDLEPMATGQQARHVIEIIEKGYIAAKTGQTQNLQTTIVSN